jgi:hypothetical protein
MWIRIHPESRDSRYDEVSDLTTLQGFRSNSFQVPIGSDVPTCQQDLNKKPGERGEGSKFKVRYLIN